jgi:hypothetical protein
MHGWDEVLLSGEVDFQDWTFGERDVKLARLIMEEAGIEMQIGLERHLSVVHAQQVFLQMMPQ